MTVTIQREPSIDGATLSAVYIDGKYFCWGLEDQIRERAGEPVTTWKVYGKTAIPSGRYRLTLSHSARFGRLLPEVLEVPGFSGNYQEDTEGCLLVGTGRSWNSVTGSRVALEKLLQAWPSVGEHWIDYRQPFTEEWTR
jgi:hypothetical protein